MTNYLRKFQESIDKTFLRIVETEEKSIDAASDLLVGSIKRDELIYIIGTGGHSMIGAMEMFWRAGCLAPFQPLLEPGLMVSEGAKHSNWIERTEGLAPSVLSSYEVPSGATMIIVNAYGINAFTIDMALECKKRGIRTIGVTSTAFAEKVPKGVAARHSSGKNLHEIVDVFVNSYMPYGDAALKIDGFEHKIAPMSTFVSSFCLHCIVIRTTEKLVAAGIEPPIWISGNVPEGDKLNQKLHDRYNSRVKHLR
ncbi:MAG TPA: SIS domain-containing protein [Spirochaetia bacterium]|nr:SIS domain-containing protein [Spirochaetia bacterium]